MNDDQIREQIKKHEGFRDTIYFDSVGVPTGGYGHAFLEGSKLPKVVCDILFEHDYNESVKNYETLIDRYGLRLDEARRGVLINMLFNMGLTRVMKFKKMIAAIQDWNFDRAADEMLDSKWAKQVGRRAIELSEIMRGK